MSNISELEKCPNCGKSLKGIFSTEKPVLQEKTDFINQFRNDSKEGYCTSCYEKISVDIVNELSLKKGSLTDQIKELIDFMPIITCIAPDKWDYQILNMVETQITAGTGVLTDLSRGINDLFGTTSNSSNAKIEKSTNRCKRALKYKALKIGGNAVMSVDIDYNEVGSGSTNMLMVCMAGTAIKINNFTHFPSDLKTKMEDLFKFNQELGNIQQQLIFFEK